jgi:hypothetical protein
MKRAACELHAACDSHPCFDDSDSALRNQGQMDGLVQIDSNWPDTQVAVLPLAEGRLSMYNIIEQCIQKVFIEFVCIPVNRDCPNATNS